MKAIADGLHIARYSYIVRCGLLGLVLYATWGLTMIVRCAASAFGHPLVMLNEVISDTRVVPD